jgi:hypothetical protein
MPFKSILPTPQASVIASLATGILVYAVWNQNVPTTGTIHATDANDINIEASRKKAAIETAGVLAVVTLLTKDVNVFILGGVVLFALDFSTRHANASNPATGALVSDTGYDTQLRSVS